MNAMTSGIMPLPRKYSIKRSQRLQSTLGGGSRSLRTSVSIIQILLIGVGSALLRRTRKTRKIQMTRRIRWSIVLNSPSFMLLVFLDKDTGIYGLCLGTALTFGPIQWISMGIFGRGQERMPLMLHGSLDSLRDGFAMSIIRGTPSSTKILMPVLKSGVRMETV